MSNKPRFPTLWEVPDGLWDRIVPILAQVDPPASTGRPRVDLRRVIDGIIFRMRTGCQWNHIPKVYGDDSTIHRHFQHWVQLGVFERIWAMLVQECEGLGDVEWEWQSADTRLGKARLGGMRSARIPRIGPRTAPKRASSPRVGVGRSPW